MKAIFTPAQEKSLQIAVNASAILSFIGSIAMIISTFFTENYFGRNKLWNRIILLIGFWDFCSATDILIRSYFLDIGGKSCKIHGITLHFFFLNSLLYSTLIAFIIFVVTAVKNSINFLRKYELLFHVVIWAFSLTFTIPLYIIDSVNESKKPILGKDNLWCWITNDYGKYRILFFYGPLWIIFILNAIIYSSQVIMVNKMNKYYSKGYLSFKDIVMKRSILYLVVIFLTWIWGTMNRVQNLIDNKNSIFILYLFHGIFTPLQGFLNSLFYFWNIVIRHYFTFKRNGNYAKKDISMKHNQYNQLESINSNDNNDTSSVGDDDDRQLLLVMNKYNIEDINDSYLSDVSTKYNNNKTFSSIQKSPLSYEKLVVDTSKGTINNLYNILPYSPQFNYDDYENESVFSIAKTNTYKSFTNNFKYP